MFVETSIVNHFNLEHHILIETNVLGYVIGGIFSELILNNLGQWHPVAFFFRKMIPVKTGYEIYDGKLLAIVEAFKT